MQTLCAAGLAWRAPSLLALSAPAPPPNPSPPRASAARRCPALSIPPSTSPSPSPGWFGNGLRALEATSQRNDSDDSDDSDPHGSDLAGGLPASTSPPCGRDDRLVSELPRRRPRTCPRQPAHRAGGTSQHARPPARRGRLGLRIYPKTPPVAILLANFDARRRARKRAARARALPPPVAGPELPIRPCWSGLPTRALRAGDVCPYAAGRHLQARHRSLTPLRLLPPAPLCRRPCELGLRTASQTSAQREGRGLSPGRP